MTEKAAQHTRSDVDPPRGEPGSLKRIRIVLVNTTHPGNIGAAARAMKVMGLSGLHLVTPKSFPHADATARASGADDVLRAARVHATLDAAVEGCGLVLGTSARLRSLSMPQLDARRAAEQAIAETSAHEVAVLFGRERHGLTNAEIQRCNSLVHIDANPEYASLNIAQAVQVLCYELRVAATPGSGGQLAPLDWAPVDNVQMERLFEHLEQVLGDIRFLNPAQPKRLMMRLRRLFMRARPDQNEINILRGILTATQEAAARSRSEQRPKA